jgi:hypothetical protein
VTHPTPRSCQAPLPCPAALSPRRIRLSPPALSPRQIPPGGHHREAGESLGIRAVSTQPTSEFGADGALPDRTSSRECRKDTNGYAHAGRKARISAPTKDAVVPEKKNNQAKPKKAQVPDAPEVRASPRERTYSRSSEQRYQPNQGEEELPELNRQVEKENGRSRSSGAGSMQR